MSRFANIIIDIAHERLDRPFQYLVPEELSGRLQEGMEVTVPFGSGDKERKGYVVALTDTPEFDVARMKYILHINEKAVGMEGRILSLAAWMKHHYGSTMITAMRTVLPVKKKVKEKQYKNVIRQASEEEIRAEIGRLNPVRFAARIRLLSALLTADSLPMPLVSDKLNISSSVLQTAVKNGLVRTETQRMYRGPVVKMKQEKEELLLSGIQQKVVDGILEEMGQEHPRPALIRGITGSGKTEVYIALIREVIKRGQQAIVLIPEIALTFQTLMRFYERFGERVSVLHSRLSDGERYDQYERAKNGELDIMIGPRSALFTPFPHVGIVIIDEEHESSYKSEKMPKYHAREVAEYITSRDGGMLVLGSATPSLDSYYRAMQGRYALFTLDARFGAAKLPTVTVADMREELKAGNKSVFSRKLKELLTDRIYKGEQSMLFINRRGVAGFVSCRSCGEVIKCAHCDVSMTEHRNGTLVCHYCGYTIPKPGTCPACGSKMIAGFGVGTELLEDILKKEYPTARVLRMDADTVRQKDDYEKILSAFADGEADILVGTQMIVKGHDFPNVTLVGAVAADMSLHAPDYRGVERTFQLLAQAAGRAGRGERPGEVVIQSYQPEHYSITMAAAQDYEGFYKQEILYRKLADYPPATGMLLMQFFSSQKDAGLRRAGEIKSLLLEKLGEKKIVILGPAAAAMQRIQDTYRVGLYVRHREESVLIEAKDLAEELQNRLTQEQGRFDVSLQFDFNPLSGF